MTIDAGGREPAPENVLLWLQSLFQRRRSLKARLIAAGNLQRFTGLWVTAVAGKVVSELESTKLRQINLFAFTECLGEASQNMLKLHFGLSLRDLLSFGHLPNEHLSVHYIACYCFGRILYQNNLYDHRLVLISD